jgi:AraC-like DNA-binding protein
MHWHDYYELWLATAGRGQYRCGNHQFAFRCGDVILVDPLKIHGVVRMERVHAPLVVFFRREAVASGGSLVDLGFLSAWDRRPDFTPPRLRAESPAAAAVHRALLHLAQSWFRSEPNEARLLQLKFHLVETLLQLRAAFPTHGPSAREPQPWRAEREARLGRVLEYVAQHCQTRLPQAAAAKVAGMSTSRFRAFFKATTGWGFGDYLRDVRLERAARLLREDSGSVAEVAYHTGFADQSHLQRLFKAKYGISPLAYRRQHQQEPARAKNSKT